MGKFISQTVRDTRQRTSGLIAETRTQIKTAKVSEDVVLVVRVQAQIGHMISRAGTVDMSAHQGRVTLSGSIPTHKIEKLLSAMVSAAGVTAVNRLESNHATASVVHVRNNHGMHQGDSWSERR